MKLCVPFERRFRLFLVADEASESSRLMSDYEVNLVNDSMQEFFVRFYGPKESTSTLAPPSTLLSLYWIFIAELLIKFTGRVCVGFSSSVRWRRVEDPCRASRSVPVQIP